MTNSNNGDATQKDPERTTASTQNSHFATDGGKEVTLSPHTEIINLSGRWAQTGELARVECTSTFTLGGEDEDGNYVRSDVEKADLRYAVDDDGVAQLSRIIDAYTPGLSEEAEPGISPSLLRTLPAAEEAIEAVPGVERVEPASQTLGRPIDVEGGVGGDRDD